jgi:RNA 2',3'-cyclic 3'-phosphodiesterase
MTMLRAFIAIDLSDDLQKAISRLTSQLQARAGKTSVRWVAAENLHLTLKFLGDVSPTNVEAIQESIKVEAEKASGFTLQVGKLNAFPNLKRPRVIVLSMDTPPELTSLQRGIDSETTRLGYPSEDRVYSPHLTLGRVRENASAIDLSLLATAISEMQPGPLPSVSVERINLYKSDLRPGGSVYTRLYSTPLKLST